MQLLDDLTWRAQAHRHRARIDEFVIPHLERKTTSRKHPVNDFLFTYYSHRPAQLRRWHPGFGVALPAQAVQEYRDLKGYRLLAGGEIAVSADYLDAQRPLIRSFRSLMCATANRAGNFGCFGLHEWAMVYRIEQDETRHADWPLRLGGAGTDEVVDTHRIACSHFDAYRFFTESARDLNTLRPGREDRVAFEQPACFHANMDLYKVAFRLSPLICSDLVADCFELARDIREIDMRAAPYDLRDLGFEPIEIETTTGKQRYAQLQREFAERSAPVRARLIGECDRLLSASGSEHGAATIAQSR